MTESYTNSATITTNSDSIGDEIELLRTGQVKPHQLILDDFLETIQTVDFRQRLELDADGNIKQKHLIVLVIDELLMLILKNDFGLCIKNDFVYLYNGAFWKPLDRAAFRFFLGKLAEKLGVNELEAKHYLFRENLYKQFLAVAEPPIMSQTQAVLVNLQNGTLEISGDDIALTEFLRGDFLTYQLPFAYDETATAPLFDRYLSEVLPDPNLQNILAEFIGYCFTRTENLKLEKVLFLYGSGANGKSVIFEIISAIFAKENLTCFSMQNLGEEHNRALITDKLLNYASELGGKKMIDSDLFKKMSSGEPIQCRLKYGNSFESNRYAKLLFNCNELPKDIEHTHAFFRRFLIVPFNVQIAQSEQDVELAKKIIQSELSGVFNWILQGLFRLLKNKKFTASETVKDAVKNFERESDSAAMFLDDNNLIPSIQYKRLFKDFYAAYRLYCQEDGYKPLNKSNFRKRLAHLKVVVDASAGNNNYVWVEEQD